MMAHDGDVFEITSEATSKASGATKVLTDVSVMQRAPLVMIPLKQHLIEKETRSECYSQK